MNVNNNTGKSDELQDTKHKKEGGIRKAVWQTAPAKTDRKISDFMNTWKHVPGWTYNFMSDDAVKDHLVSAFPTIDFDKVLEQRAILAYDLFRYSIIYQEGGLYADSDVEIASEFEDSMEKLKNCNVIIGVEADYRTDTEWVRNFPRSLQFTQWSFYAAPKHPMMKFVVDRVVRQIEWYQVRDKNLHNEDVMEVTGPGIWTDSILDYISVTSGIDAKKSMECGQFHKFNDICILNVRGYALSMPHSICKTENDENSFIINIHHFLGSWKHG